MHTEQENIPYRRMKGTPGRASDYIHHLSDLLEPGKILKVVLYYRVSTETQYRNGNHIDEMNQLIETVKKIEGVQIVAQEKEQDQASALDCRFRFRHLVQMAKEAGAVIVTTCRNRFVRNRRYHPKHIDTHYPTVEQYQALLELAQGVPLATYMDPDASDKETRSFLTKAGQAAKGRRGGRPKKTDNAPGKRKRRKAVLLPMVKRLHEEGLSFRKISNHLKGKSNYCDISHQTVKNWLSNKRFSP